MCVCVEQQPRVEGTHVRAEGQPRNGGSEVARSVSKVDVKVLAWSTNNDACERE
jgi:hypothetical protein